MILQKHNLFGSRETVEKATKYAFEMIETFKDEDKVAAVTAIAVIWNTLSDELEREKAGGSDEPERSFRL